MPQTRTISIHPQADFYRQKSRFELPKGGAAAGNADLSCDLSAGTEQPWNELLEEAFLGWRPVVNTRLSRQLACCSRMLIFTFGSVCGRSVHVTAVLQQI